ncbi:hypothetical protein EJB05_06915, partial [Eragrostis curvula]
MRRSSRFLVSKSQLLLCGNLLPLQKRFCLHLAELIWLARHRQRTLGVRMSVLKSALVGIHLTRDDDRVDYLTFRVVHGQHVEPATADVLRINDGVQEPTRPVRAAHDEGRAVRHVPAKVRDHVGLLLGRHADKRGEEDHVVLAEHIGQCGDVGRVEGHARAQVLVRAEQLLCALVGGAAHVVVVELRVRQVARGEHQRAERQRARPDEGDAGRCQARDVLDQELVLQLAKVDVVAEVREAAEVVERVVEAGDFPSASEQRRISSSRIFCVSGSSFVTSTGLAGTQVMTRSVNSASTSGDGLRDGSLAMAAWRPVIFCTRAETSMFWASIGLVHSRWWS